MPLRLIVSLVVLGGLVLLGAWCFWWSVVALTISVTMMPRSRAQTGHHAQAIHSSDSPKIKVAFYV